MDTLADVYTPTKAMDGTCLMGSDTSLPETPPVYVPTRISELARKAEETPSKEETTRQKYGSSVGDTYSPSNPGIRIVKRKPNATKVNEAAAAVAAVASVTASPNANTTLGKRSAPENDADPAVVALKTTPLKGIIRIAPSLNKRPARRIFFADTRGLPLCSVKEIEKITVHHSNTMDFRHFEKNEAVFGREYDLEDVEWALVPVRGARSHRKTLSETGIIEEQRVADLGLMRGPIFGVCEVIEDPELDELAAEDYAKSVPIMIPTEPMPTETSRAFSALHDLPLPGRPQNSNSSLITSADQSQQNDQPIVNHYEQISGSACGNIYEATMADAAPFNGPVIKQIFQESGDSVGNTYYATISSTPPPKIEIPANLKEILDKLKKKGFVSDDSATSAPVVESSLTAPVPSVYQMFETNEAEVGGNIYYGTMDTARQDYSTRKNDSWVKPGRKQEVCDFYVNRPSGCNKGDQCRFVHDEDMRRQRLAERNSFNREREDRGYRGGHRGRGSFRGGFRQNQSRSGQNNSGRTFDSYSNASNNFSAPPPQHSSHGYGSAVATSTATVSSDLGLSKVAVPTNLAANTAAMLQQQQFASQASNAFGNFQAPSQSSTLPSNSPVLPITTPVKESTRDGSKRRSRFDQVDTPQDVDERPRRGRQTRFDAPPKQDQDDRFAYQNY